MRAALINVWTEAWNRLAPRTRVGNIRVRPRRGDWGQSLAFWEPGWMSTLIGAVLSRRPGAFIDVGANAGQTLLEFVAASTVGEYIGFEPNPAAAAAVANLIAVNKFASVRVMPVGLSDENGIRNLYLFGGDIDPGASTDRALRPALNTRAVPIAVFRFDDILADLGNPGISLIKIDVEGAELWVLKGMAATLKNQKPWILCEVLDRDAAANAEAHRGKRAELTNLIQQLGYEAHRVIRDASDRCVRGFIPIQEFPDKQWDEASAAECDYMLVPAGHGPELNRVLEQGHGELM